MEGGFKLTAKEEEYAGKIPPGEYKISVSIEVVNVEDEDKKA
jgi:hypothetical protein